MLIQGQCSLGSNAKTYRAWSKDDASRTAESTATIDTTGTNRVAEAGQRQRQSRAPIYTGDLGRCNGVDPSLPIVCFRRKAA